MSLPNQNTTPKVRRTVSDRVVSWFSPTHGLKRLRARAFLDVLAGVDARRYEAAANGRRTSGWKASHSSANQEISFGYATLRSRHRQLVRDNEYAGKAVEIWEDEIGAYRADAASEATEEIWPLWEAFAEGALDPEGISSFEDYQNQIIRAAVEGGDGLLRRRYRRIESGGAVERGLPVPLQIELLEGDYLDHEKNTTSRNSPIIQGVQFDNIRSRVAYWLHKEHPSEAASFGNSSPVPAVDIHHVFRRLRTGQVRGVPFGISCMLTLRDLDDYADATLLRAKLANCFVAFIEDPDAGLVPGVQTAWKTEEEPPDTLQPGAMEVLPTGRSVKFSDPPAPQGLAEIMGQGIHQVAVGYRVPHSMLSGDYSKVNFTQGRMEQINFGRSVFRMRRSMALPAAKKIWKWFVEALILSGQGPSKNPEDYKVTWTPPRRELTDPSRLAPALERLAKMGYHSVSEIIRESGRDPEVVFQEIADEQEALRELGIELPGLKLLLSSADD